MENGDKLTAVEIKSGKTFDPDFFRNLNYWNRISGNSIESGTVIYGGDISRDTVDGRLLAWRELDKIAIG
jgi:hypothetical protein